MKDKVKKDKLIIKLLNGLTPNATNIVIGGHYNFPDEPNKFAINSIIYSKNITKTIDNSILFSFINDIGFNNFCNYGVCQIPTEKIRTHKGYVIQSVGELWNKTFDEIKLIENNVGIEMNPDFISQCKKILFANSDSNKLNYNDFSSFFTHNYKQNIFLVDTIKQNISPVFYLLKAFSANKLSNDFDSLKWSIDYFLYHFDKENFHPISFFENDITSKTIFEKSIYNFSSKSLRKLGNKGILKGLIIDKQGTETTYKCKSYVGNDIILRIENLSNDSFNAINKCPSIIASLYYKIVKENCEKNEINIFYNVPSYDRVKVDLGTEVFFRIYFPYLKQYFGINKVNIINHY